MAVTKETVEIAYNKMHSVLRGNGNAGEQRITVAEYMSKLCEAMENDEITDDEFFGGLSEIEHYLWTGRECE